MQHPSSLAIVFGSIPHPKTLNFAPGKFGNSDKLPKQIFNSKPPTAKERRLVYFKFEQSRSIESVISRKNTVKILSWILPDKESVGFSISSSVLE